MADSMKQAWDAVGIDRSPLLADLKGEPAHGWRFLLAIPSGLVAGVMVAFLIVLIAGVAAMFGLSAAGVDIDLPSWLTGITAPDFEPTYWVALGMIWSLAILNAAMMLVFVWVASLVLRKPLKASFTAAPRWRWRQLFGGFLLYGVMIGAVLLIQVLFFGQTAELPVLRLSPSAAHVALFALAAFGGLTLAAGAEELVFRGWLLRHTAALSRRAWVYILINGLLFSAIHGDFDPNAFLARAAMGCGFSWMALRLGGIEFATGAHTANNLLIVLFIEPLTFTVPDPGPFSLGMALETAVTLGLMVAATELAARTSLLRKWLGGPAEPPAAPNAFD